jgi:hypothetical protein
MTISRAEMIRTEEMIFCLGIVSEHWCVIAVGEEGSMTGLAHRSLGLRLGQGALGP